MKMRLCSMWLNCNPSYRCNHRSPHPKHHHCDDVFVWCLRDGKIVGKDRPCIEVEVEEEES